MKLFGKGGCAFAAAIFSLGLASAANADVASGDHSLRLTTDDVASEGAHDFALSDIYLPGQRRSFTESFTLIIDKLLRTSALVTENTGIEQFTSFGLYSNNNLVTGSTTGSGDLANASLILTDLLPGSYELRVAGILDGAISGRYSVSADAVATPIPTAAWFFAPAIATVFGLRRRKGKLLQSA